jgi:hypothetical protein
MLPMEFIEKWKPVTLTEMSAYQQHFLDLRELLNEKKPAEVDPTGDSFTFQKGLTTNLDTKGSPTPGNAAASAGNTRANTRTWPPPTCNS